MGCTEVVLLIGNHLEAVGGSRDNAKRTRTNVRLVRRLNQGFEAFRHERGSRVQADNDVAVASCANFRYICRGWPHLPLQVLTKQVDHCADVQELPVVKTHRWPQVD